MTLTATVKWGRTPSAAEIEDGQYHRHMERTLSRKAAAELASDIIFVLYGPNHSNAWSDKHFLVSREMPSICWYDSTKTHYVEVRLTGA